MAFNNTKPRPGEPLKNMNSRILICPFLSFSFRKDTQTHKETETDIPFNQAFT